MQIFVPYCDEFTWHQLILLTSIDVNLIIIQKCLFKLQCNPLTHNPYSIYRVDKGFCT